MAKHISNMNQLQKALQPVMKNMVDKLADRDSTINNGSLVELAVKYLWSQGIPVRY